MSSTTTTTTIDPDVYWAQKDREKVAEDNEKMRQLREENEKKFQSEKDKVKSTIRSLIHDQLVRDREGQDKPKSANSEKSLFEGLDKHENLEDAVEDIKGRLDDRIDNWMVGGINAGAWLNTGLQCFTAGLNLANFGFDLVNGEIEQQLKLDDQEIKIKAQRLAVGVSGLKTKLDTAASGIEETLKAVGENEALLNDNSAAISANKAALEENARKLKQNHEAIKKYEVVAKKNFYKTQAHFADVEKRLAKVMETLQETKQAIVERIDAMALEVESAIYHDRVDPLVRSLKQFFEKFINDQSELAKLPAYERIQRLEDSSAADLLVFLQQARLPKEDTLHTNLNDLINEGFAVPKDANDKYGFMVLNLLVYGTQVYGLVFQFLVQQYAFLTETAQHKSDLDLFNATYLKLLKVIDDFTGSLLEEGAMIDRVIDVLTSVKELDFIKRQRPDVVRSAKRSIVHLAAIRVILGRIGNSFDSNVPERLNPKLIFEGVNSNRNGSEIELPILNWEADQKVQYALQYYSRASRTPTMIGDWSRPYTLDRFANPLVSDIPLDPLGRIRVIYRRFDEGEPELCAILTDSSVTSFRDIDRDLYNAALESNSEVSLPAMRIYLAHNASVNAQFENAKRVIHGAAENVNPNVTQMLLSKGAEIDAKDSDGHTALYIASELGNLEVVREMIGNNANLNAPTSKEYLHLTPLHTAAYKGRSEIVQELMKSKLRIDLNTEAQNGLSPLHFAASFEQPDIVQSLIHDNRTVIESRNWQNFTSLHLAAVNNCEKVSTVLLGSGRVDVNAKATDHSTPLHLSAAFGNVELVGKLLASGASVAARTKDGSTALHYAAFNGNRDIFERLASQNRVLVDAQNDAELTPLYVAYQYNKTEVASMLSGSSKYCANVNLKLTENKSLLHVAAKNGDKAAVENLIKQGLDVNALDNTYWKPLHYAVANGHVEVVKQLLEHGTKPGVSVNSVNQAVLQDKDSFTPALHLTILFPESTALTLAKLLIAHGAVADERWKRSETLLHQASKLGYTMLAKSLVDNDANVNATTVEGNLPLHEAVANGHLELAQMLIKRKSNVNAANKQKQTPLHLAAAQGYFDIVKLLIENKASIDPLDSCSKTPLFYAIEGKGTSEMIKYLLDHKTNVNQVDCKKNTIPDIVYLRPEISILIRQKYDPQMIDRKANSNEDGDTGAHFWARSGDDISLLEPVYKIGIIDYYQMVFEVVNKWGESPLYAAIEARGGLKMVKLLVAAKSDLTVVSKRTNLSLIEQAAVKQKFDVVNYLLSITPRNAVKSLDLVLKQAVKFDNFDEVLYLVQNYGSNHFTEKSYQAALLESVSGEGGKTRIEIVRFLARKVLHKAKLDSISGPNNSSLVNEAVKANRTDVVQFFIEKGADFRSTDANGVAPLHNAAGQNNIRLAKYFLDHGVNVDLADKQGDTPIRYAIAQKGKLDMVTLLVENNADITKFNSTKTDSLVYQAIMHDKYDIAEYLIQKRSPIKIAGHSGDSPLHAAVARDSPAMIRLLLAKGAKLDYKNSKEQTPLELAIADRKEQSIRFFVIEGKKRNNRTALHEAVAKNDLTLAKVLLERGADVNAQDSSQSTPLHIAAFDGKLDMVKLLASQRCADLTLLNGYGTPAQAAHYNNMEKVGEYLDKLGRTRGGGVKLGRSLGSSGHGPDSVKLVDLPHSPDWNGTILLLDLVARLQTRKRYIPPPGHGPVSPPLDARVDAMKISESLEALVEELSKKVGATPRSVDYFTLFQTVEKLLTTGQYGKIDAVLRKTARSAFADRALKNKAFADSLKANLDRLINLLHGQK